MKFLKALGLSLIGILLFFSLSLFGLAFAVNSTVLSPRFITTEINRIDISYLTQEMIDESGADFPASLQSDLITTIDKIEPLVKNKMGDAVYSVYDYLLGKKPSPGLAKTLQGTFMNSGFITSLLDGIDIRALAKEAINENTVTLPDDINLITPYLDPGLAELAPWIKQQAASVAGPVFDYMLGQTDDFSVSISPEPVKKVINGVIKEAFLNSPPSILAGQPRAALSLYYDDYVSDLLESMSEPIVIDPETLSDNDPGDIVLTGPDGPIAEAEKALETARTYVSYFQTGFWLLLGFILLLILGIVLIYRQVRGACRDLSIIFLTCGIPALAGVLIARTAVSSLLSQTDIPVQIQTLATNICYDTLAPYMWYTIGLVIVGIALLVVSLVVKAPEKV
jgi:hypothetical protein